MTLSYRTTYADAIAFAIHYSVRNWLMQLAFAVLIFMSARANLQAVSGADVPLAFRVVGFVVVEAVIIVGFLVLALLVIALSFLSRRNRTFFTDHTLTLDEMGVREQTIYNDTVHNWSAIQKLGRTRRHLFLYVSGQSGHVIPRRAVGSHDQWEALWRLAREHAGQSA